jgi:hypothetical protein
MVKSAGNLENRNASFVLVFETCELFFDATLPCTSRYCIRIAGGSSTSSFRDRFTEFAATLGNPGDASRATAFRPWFGPRNLAVRLRFRFSATLLPILK